MDGQQQSGSGKALTVAAVIVVAVLGAGAAGVFAGSGGEQSHLQQHNCSGTTINSNGGC